MYKSRVGGVIAAASKKDAIPLLQIGSIPIIKRIVITYQQAGIFPIVIITGANEDEVKYQLAPHGLIFIHNEHSETPQLIESAKIGMNYLKDKCEKIVFTPVNAPMFTPSTLEKLINCSSMIVTPSYQGIGGHPIVFNSAIIDKFFSYDGMDGMRGAISSLESERQWLDVDDEGITLSVHDEEQLQARLAEHNRSILNSFVKIYIAKEKPFFDSRAKLLLYLIGITGSVRKACDQMALSYGKAWVIINELEEKLEYAIVERKQGGSKGGQTMLTERGSNFINAYQEFEESILQHAHSEFERLFEKQALV